MAPPETPVAWKLSADLLHEIVARSDHRTLVRFAATCKLLRCDILSPPFDPRVTDAAPCILAYMWPDAKKPLALVHPTTLAASSFCHEHLSHLVSRKTAKILCKYKPVVSRHGLVVLRRRNFDDRPNSSHPCTDTCVYDPMSGAKSFFSNPQEIQSDCDRKYVLLTAADGIDTSSFLLLAFDLHGWDTRVHTASSRGTWQSVTYQSLGDKHYFPSQMLKKRGDPAILSGGIVHWLPKSDNRIVRCDLGTRKMGSVDMPTNCNDGNQLYLATSTDRKLLKLLSIQGFKLFVWLQLPVSTSVHIGWSLETVIDMKEKLWSLDPYIRSIEFEGSGKMTGEVVFLVVKLPYYSPFYANDIIVFDLEKKKMHRQKPGLALLEIDQPSRLQTMKIFS